MGTEANLLEMLIGKKEVSKLSRRERFYYNECLGRIPAQKFLEFLNNHCSEKNIHPKGQTRIKSIGNNQDRCVSGLVAVGDFENYCSINPLKPNRSSKA
jgi:hypothetical protein